MKMKDAYTISEDQFDLTPVLKAAKNQDREAMKAFFDQGYALSWQDHRTHESLLFALGKELDIKAIRFIESLDAGRTGLSDAVEGAAFANKNINEIEKIASLESNYCYALRGAARGKHGQLLSEIINRVKSFNESYDVMGAHFIVEGAAEANDQFTLQDFTTGYYRKRNNDLLKSQISGAARGGHTKEVIQLLLKHARTYDHIHMDMREDAIMENGLSIAYRQAMHGAAIAGNTALIAKLFLHLDQVDPRYRGREDEDPLWLIKDTIETAAFHGHYDLVFDLIGRAKLYITNSDKQVWLSLIMSSALSGAISGSRYKLVAILFSHGAKAEDAANTIKNLGYNRDIVKKFFRALNNPRLCYQIAYIYDHDQYHHGRNDLTPVFNEMYFPPFPISKEAKDLYFHNNELSIWFNNHDKLHYKSSTQTPPCNHDAAIMIAAYATQGRSSEKVLRESRHLSRFFDSQMNQDKSPSPPKSITDKIRQQILDEIDAYLKSSLIAHTNRAKALYSCVKKLSSIESIYLLIRHQIELMHGEPATGDQLKPASALAESARTPTVTGHSYLRSLFNASGSIDFLDRMENCIKIIASYQSEPKIRDMLSNHAIFDKPEFSKYDA